MDYARAATGHSHSARPAAAAAASDSEAAAPAAPTLASPGKRTSMKVAVEGCCHGALDEIYARVLQEEAASGVKVDVLLVCGDFEAIRDEHDLMTKVCPARYRHMNNFHQYYHGDIAAPVLTILVGGNHEASRHMWELPYGGWVAPNIYYMGYAGVVNVGGLRIGGWSGIYEEGDYLRGHYENPPFSANHLRSVYHTREFECFQLSHVTGKLDVLMTHDWPLDIAHYGDTAQLLRENPTFTRDVEAHCLGSPGSMHLIRTLRPSHFFAGHMHTRFTAAVPHDKDGRVPPTRFLALSKPLPRHQFIEFMDIPCEPFEGEVQLRFDPQWLAILKLTSRARPIKQHAQPIKTPPGPVPDDLVAAVVARLVPDGVIPPAWFKPIVPRYIPGPLVVQEQPGPLFNPQTELLCRMIEVPNPCLPFLPPAERAKAHGGGQE